MSALHKVLYLGSQRDKQIDLADRFGDDVEIIEVHSPIKALAQLTHGQFSALFVDAEYFAQAAEVGRLIQNDRLLQELPVGVVLLDSENKILWGNGRLREWSQSEQVIGHNFYEVLGTPDIIDSDHCPFQTALSTGKSSAATMRCANNRYYRLHAAPLHEENGEVPQHLVVSVHDISDEVLQQQKVDAIHQAGTELADLTTDEVANLSVSERIDLLKDNILHCTQDVLDLDVVEIRMLDQETGVLEPLISIGMEPTAAQRKLYSSDKGYGVTGFVAATGKSYLCEHTAEDPLYLEGSKCARSSLTVPLTLHDQVIGTLNVESPEPNAFDESDLQFLEIFARTVAIALNTLELLAAEKASTAVASVEAIHSAVALPVDVILNDAVNVMERSIGHSPDVVERLRRILKNARDIKRVIQKVGQSMAPGQAQPSCALEARPQLAGKRILVVDADEAARSAAHGLLERYHCIVETAHDGNEAGYMVRTLGPDERYDVIISDIRLPDMNAFELLLKLRGTLDHVPFVLMTGFGYDPDHTVIKARQAGVSTVLYKPFRLDQLVTTIEEMVERNKKLMNEE